MLAETETSGAEDPQAQKSASSSTSVAGSVPSKLDSLPREDLIRLVKKQLLTLKETRKQLDTAKKEAEEHAARAAELASASASSDVQQQQKSDGMMAMELEDYKNALGEARKELNGCKTQMQEKDTLLQELSDRIAQLQQEREEVSAELRAKSAHCSELTQTVDEKCRLLAENAKEIDSLQVLLADARQGAQEELGTLQADLRKLGSELAAERRSTDARGAELRRLRADNEQYAQRVTSLQEEFAAYKERAACALAQRTSDACGTSAPSATISSSSAADLQQLIDTLSARNTQIAQLNAKCSFLEEELRSGQAHARTLLDEINALHDQQQAQRQQWRMERQKANTEQTERLRSEETLRAELQRELQASREREMAAIAAKQMATVDGEKRQQVEVDELRRECDRLARELEEAKTKAKQQSPKSQQPYANNNNFSRPNPPLLMMRPLKPGPLNLNLDLNRHSDPLELDPTEEGGTTNHSESSDSLDDLQSVLQDCTGGDGSISGGYMPPSFNIASVGDAFEKSDLHHQQQLHFVSQEQHQLLANQLADTRELLNETEENNVRLSEQVSVLKEEIRRIERSQKRAEQLGNGVCSEYFKNIVLKFLAPPKVADERMQLLPVLQTILHLNPAELEQVRRNCTVQQHDETGDEPHPSGEGQEVQGGQDLWSSWIGWR